MRTRIRKGYYWAAIWPNGRQLWGASTRREVERAARGTGCRIIQRPMHDPDGGDKRQITMFDL